MSRFDFRPRSGGAEYDPAAAGGVVKGLGLWAGPDRSGPPALQIPAPSRPRPGVYRFEIPDSLPPGRYWGTVTYSPGQGQPDAVDASVRLDLPNGTGLVTSPEAVGKMLRLQLPLTGEQREDLVEEILRAQADVAAYLNQPLTAQIVVLEEATPAYGVDLADWQAWRRYLLEDFEVDSWVERSDGTFDVTLRVGLDGAAELPIVRYVTAHAAEALRAGGIYGQRRVSSVSAEGQSVSYESAPAAASSVPGALPSISSLDGYVQPPVFTRKSPPAAPWPYGPTHGNRW